LPEAAQRCYVSLSALSNPMLRGIVKFRARIVDQERALTFPSFEFYPTEPGVEKVEIEGPKDNEILSIVHLFGLEDAEDGIAIATKVHTAALDRICFFHDIAIENGRFEHEFSPTDNPHGLRITGGTRYQWIVLLSKVTVSLFTADLKPKLERVAPPGERNFGLFRSARQSASPVEEFMHLYNILLMLFDDKQSKVDKFIQKENRSVPLTPDPRPKKNGTETLYTRLRNELAHKRTGVNLENTKAAMKKNLGELIALTKRAIELHS